MEDLHKYRYVNKLKSVYRVSSNGDRKETDAEHTWGCLMLADYLLSRLNLDIDRLKVYEMLMYHDMVEIVAGDTPLDPDNPISREEQVEKEMIAIHTVADNLPQVMADKLIPLFTEFEEQKTAEARFAKAVDQLEALIQEMDYKEDWKGWNEEFLRSKKEHYFKDFPEIKSMFNEIVVFLRENAYFDQ